MELQPWLPLRSDRVAMPERESTDDRIVRIISGSVLTPLICIDATVEPWSESVAKIRSDFAMVVMGKRI